LDNRRSNLRPVTGSQNRANGKDRPRAGKYRGAYWHKQAGKWIAQVSVGGELKYLGLFENEEEAGRAYDVASVEARADYAVLNFPHEWVDLENLSEPSSGTKVDL